MVQYLHTTMVTQPIMRYSTSSSSSPVMRTWSDVSFLKTTSDAITGEDSISRSGLINTLTSVGLNCDASTQFHIFLWKSVWLFKGSNPDGREQLLIVSHCVVVVVCFHNLKFFLSSQLMAASCARDSDMPPSKQVNGQSFTICLMVCCTPQSQSGEAV